jgi:cytochrome b
MSTALVRVWDPFVRVFHWGLVASCLVAWLSADDPRWLHLWAGYAALALIVLRIFWGVVGTRHARFASFVRGPRTTLEYVAAIATGREARFIGHNPAGGAMIVAMVIGMLALCITGWMYTTDMFWGVDWVENTHTWISDLMVVLVVLHIAGTLLASWRHRENLVGAMITGRKREGK